MSKARTLAQILGSDGILNVADLAGLAAVASSGSATDLTTGTLPNGRLATGAAVANLGYTPVNKAGDGMTGQLKVVTSGAISNAPTDASQQVTDNLKIVIPNNSTRRIYSLGDTSSSYNLGVTGGAAIRFDRDSGGSDELAFETHYSGFWHREQMRVDKYGRVTKPYQPAMFAVKNSTVTTTGVITNYDNVYVNVGGYFNNSTGTFTCPLSGKYLVTVSSLLSSGTYHIDDQVQKNGSTISGYWLRSSINGAGEYETNSATMLFDCATSDTLRFNIANKTGDMYSDGNGWIRFMVYFLG